MRQDSSHDIHFDDSSPTDLKTVHRHTDRHIRSNEILYVDLDMTTCNISRTKFVMSIDISHIFRSKYCFFSILTRCLSCVMRSFVSICA